VLFDAVALLPSRDGAALLAKDAAARDFVSDAFAHCKFIGFTDEARPLLEKAGVLADLDDGCRVLATPNDAQGFIQACGQLRFWPRELKVDLDAMA
jgi:catalase